MRWLVAFGSFLRICVRLRPVSVWKYFVSARRSGVFAVRLRGYLNPIHIRGRSSDRWVLGTVLVGKEYHGLIDFAPETILDGGANIGLASLFWVQQFPQAKIVAVEPDEENVGLLRSNIGHAANVKVIHGGLWSRTTRLAIANAGAEKYAFRVVEDSEHGPIEAWSISDVMRREGWSHIDVLKLDVEGTECELLRYAEDWIDRVNVLILELHQDFAPEGAELLFRAFSERQFTLRWRGEDLILTRRNRLL